MKWSRGAVLIGLICRRHHRRVSAECCPWPHRSDSVAVSAIGTHDVGQSHSYFDRHRAVSKVDLSLNPAATSESILQVRGADGRLRNIQEGDWVSRGTVRAGPVRVDYVANVKRRKGPTRAGLMLALEPRLIRSEPMGISTDMSPDLITTRPRPAGLNHSWCQQRGERVESVRDRSDRLLAQSAVDLGAQGGMSRSIAGRTGHPRLLPWPKPLVKACLLCAGSRCGSSELGALR